ncbi:retrovirus-related pol polyprotein from transposon TNT 1-94 [Tanacetum coccineum]|uniref:Retrovirus-related pol polyprotein from transposon TNT 1-94 n=1 Tax=Tanacetum coccineum TaxID=301880 RepID=A0ABQ5GPF0_9ASTR
MQQPTQSLGFNMDACEATLEKIIAEMGDVKVIVIGDFNKVREAGKRYGTNFNERQADMFNSFITNLNLIDVSLGGIVLEKGIPDHRPILLKESVVDYGRTPFRFFHSWLDIEGFHDLVAKTWKNDNIIESNGMISFKKKLQNVKQVIRSWVACKRLENNRLWKDHKSHLLLYHLSLIEVKVDQNIATREELIDRSTSMKIVGDIDRKEASDLAQKAKIKWAREGDENTSFFHGDVPLNRLSCQQRDFLESDFSNKEIKRAVWDCDGDRAPGPDGFTFKFIKTFWNVIESDVSWRGVERRKKGLMVFKVDFKKAYDSLRWGYLDVVMENLGFGSKWRASIGEGNLDISYLFYADDAIIVGEWSQHNAHNLICMLRCFYLVFGLKINVHKSKLIGVSVSDENFIDMAMVLGCGVTKMPMTYLVVGNLLTYYLSLYKMPTYVQKKLESMCNKLFMGGDLGDKKVTWVKWNVCLASKALGGLEASMGKMELQRKGVYLLAACKHSLGDRMNISFWIKTWCRDSSLKVLLPRAYALEGDKKSLIQDITISNNKDGWKWSLASNGFSVASARKFIDEHILPYGLSCTIWNRGVPIKVDVFMWRLNLDKLPSMVNMERKGIDIDSLLCLVCGDHVENVDPLFFSCGMARELWRLLARWFDLDIPSVASIVEWFSWVDACKVTNRLKKRRKRTWIKEMCSKHDIQFLDVQETKMTKLEPFCLKYIWGNFMFDYACSMARGLLDLPMGGRIFTWMNKTGTKLSKIDHFLIFEDVLESHSDILVTILDKLWRRDITDSLRTIENLINAGNSTDEDREQRIRKLHDLDNLEKLDSLDLLQKDRIKRDVEGDENSKFFHGIINARRKYQSIQGDGSLIRFWIDTWAGDLPLLDRFNRPILSSRSFFDFVHMLDVIGSMEVSQDSDPCFWYLSNDGNFLVSSIRHHIDDHLLPSMASSTRWCKFIPRKVLETIERMTWVLGVEDEMDQRVLEAKRPKPIDFGFDFLLDEGYSSKNYVRKCLRALHPKWIAKVTAIEESKDLTSLSLVNHLGTSKTSDERVLTSGNEDESTPWCRDDKNGKSDRKCFRCGDPNHLIGECPKPPKDKNQRAFVGGSWSDSGEEDDEKVKNETCLVAQASSEICDNMCRINSLNMISDITMAGKVIARGIRKKGLYVMKLGNKPKDQICLTMIDENSTLWHRRLGHVNMRLIQSLASKELVRNLPKLKFDQHFCDACKIRKQAHASHKAKNIVSMTRCLELLHMDLFGPSAVRSYGSETAYTLVIVDDYSRKVEESLNVTFDETPPPSKTSPLVDDDLDEEEAIKVTEKKNLENDIEDETLEIDEIVNIKESRNHPLENVIGNLNQRTLRSQAQNQSNFFCFISTIEPKNVNEALADESWIVAMQEELNQFIANDVWELVPQPRNMTIIGN